MKRRRLGRSALDVSPVGIGGWQIGRGERPGARDGADDAEAIAMIHHALELGLNWIDTAAVYGLGHSERVVARASRGLEERPHVFTKCGYVWDESGAIRRTLRSPSIRREVDASLSRLEVDVLDLYLIHWPVPDEEIEEGWSTLAELRDEGKLRHIGVSNFSVEQLGRCERSTPVEVLQPPYSLAYPEASVEIVPYCLEHDIGVIVYSPQAAGMLSGTMTRERVAELPETDDRRTFPAYQEPQLTRNFELVAELRELGGPVGASPGTMAVAWTLTNPGVTATIVGLRRPEQVDEVIVAVDERVQARSRGIRPGS